MSPHARHRYALNKCNPANLLHCVDGPAVVYPNGSEEWYQDGLLHRADGPAIDHIQGHKEWWHHGKRHRTDGPAIIYSYGTLEYWVKDVQYTEEEFYLYVDHLSGEVIVPVGKKLTYELMASTQDLIGALPVLNWYE